jgi:hypothetical protein
VDQVAGCDLPLAIPLGLLRRRIASSAPMVSIIRRITDQVDESNASGAWVRFGSDLPMTTSASCGIRPFSDANSARTRSVACLAFFTRTPAIVSGMAGTVSTSASAATSASVRDLLGWMFRRWNPFVGTP